MSAADLLLSCLASDNPSGLLSRAPLQSVCFRDHCIDLLRLDQVDPVLSGNKLFKLFYHLRRYLLEHPDPANSPPLASFGGAYSNHLHALAAVGHALGIATAGIIRGERVAPLNPTLTDLEEWGMRLMFVSRGEYRRREEPAWLAEMEQQLGQVFWVPEGGGGLEGALGCQAIGWHLQSVVGAQPLPCTDIAIACGTGTSLAGVILGLGDSPARVTGFSVLKGAAAGLTDSVQGLIDRCQRHSQNHQGLPPWSITDRFHGGGFGKLSQEQGNFISEFQRDTGVVLDPVYTAKLLTGVIRLADEGFWRGGRVIAIHTGGLQGGRPHNGETKRQWP